MLWPICRCFRKLPSLRILFRPSPTVTFSWDKILSCRYRSGSVRISQNRTVNGCCFFQGLYMMIYDPLKASLRVSTNNELISGFIAGGTVGVISWTVACPMDICKSKQQAGCSNQSLYECLREIYRSEAGVRTFFCGWSAIATRAFFLNAISLIVWDRTRRWF